MKRLLAPIIFILVTLALGACHSKKRVVIQEHHTTDTVYIEKQSESLTQSSFDWSRLGLTFDSLVVVTEPSAPAIDVGDSITRPPPERGSKTTLKVFGGKLNYDKASGEALHAEIEKSVETAAHEEDTKDNKEDAETQAATPSIIFPWWIIGVVVLLAILILFRKKIIAVAKKWTCHFLD